MLMMMGALEGLEWKSDMIRLALEKIILVDEGQLEWRIVR